MRTVLPECFLVMLLTTDELYGWATLSEERDRFAVYRIDDVRVTTSGQWADFDAALRRMNVRPLQRPCPEVHHVVEARWKVQLQSITDPMDIPCGLSGPGAVPCGGPP
jgi:hypothetical protein